MMDSIAYLFIVGAVLAFLWRLAAWVKAGAPVPGYIHKIAAGSVVVGVLMAYADHASGEASPKRLLIDVVILPVMTYVGLLFVVGRVGVDRLQGTERNDGR